MKIFLIFLIVLLFFLIFPVKCKIKYGDDFTIKLYYFFIGFRIYPQKDKKDKNDKNRGKKASKQKSETEKKIDDKAKFINIKKIKEEDGISGLITLFEDLKDIIKSLSKTFFKTIYFSKIKIFISISDETPSETAIKYGRYCGILYPLIYKIIAELNTAKPIVLIKPNYEKKEDDVLAEINILTLPITILIVFILFVIRIVKFKIKHEK